MRLLAATAAGVFVYLLAGLLLGRLPRGLRLRPRRARAPDLRAWLAHAGITATPAQFVGVSVALAVMAFLAVWAMSGAAPVAVVPAAAVGALPRAWFARQGRERLRARQRAWPDALRHLVASLEIPLSLHRGLVALAHSGPEPLRPVFARYELLATRLDHAAALRAIRAELADPLADRILKVLLVAQSHGNRIVVDILRDQADHIAADSRLAEDIETANLEKRLEARAAVVLPFAVLVLLCASSEPFREFYSSGGGAFVIGLGATMALVGMTLIGRLGRLPTEPRVLAVDDESATP